MSLITIGLIAGFVGGAVACFKIESVEKKSK
jgi:hypothetical protein